MPESAIFAESASHATRGRYRLHAELTPASWKLQEKASAGFVREHTTQLLAGEGGRTF